jgi:hypothetical protein
MERPNRREGGRAVTNDEELIKKWQGWMKVVTEDLGRSLLRRRLFEGTLKMYNENPKLQEHGGAFFWFFSGLYVDSIAAGIRRQVKENDDSISLARLLRDFSRAPAALSRERYHVLYGLAGQRIDGRVDAEFDQFAGAGGAHLDPNVIQGDLALLEQACLSVEGYADRRVAHYDKRPPKDELTPAQVTLALATLRGLVQKYFLLLNASGLDVEPVLQMPIWYAFSFPWLPERKKAAEARA